MTRVLARDARGWGTMWEIHFDLIMGLNVLFKPLAKKRAHRNLWKIISEDAGLWLKIERMQNAD